MKHFKIKLTLLLAAVGLLSMPAGASTVLQMNLGELSQRADKIFRGTVVDVTLGSVEAGGGEIPIVTYSIKVEDAIKGSFASKDGVRYVEVRMVRDPKRVVSGNYQRASLFGNLPALRKGGDYLLFTTASSSIGLSTTVGLGQGAFQVLSINKEDHVVNEVNNQGLFRGMDSAGLPGSGPIAYGSLVGYVKSLLVQ